MQQSLRQHLYSKSLALSQQERGNFSMGKLTNLYINDTWMILSCIPQGHYLWGTPFQVWNAHTVTFLEMLQELSVMTPYQVVDFDLGWKPYE